jgi:hypothetical protein
MQSCAMHQSHALARESPALLPPYTTGIVPIHIKLGVQPEGGNGEL